MNNDVETNKGFSGLSGLASDISDTIKAEHSALNEITDEKKDNKVPSPEQAQIVDPKKKVKASTNDQMSDNKKYLIFVAVVALVLWVVSQSNNQNTTSPKPQSSSQPVPTPNPTSVPARTSYTKPSVGSNNILEVSEIRWCIREGIRIDTMRNVFSSNSGIDKFNSLVNDYNSRCVNYRYRSGSQSRAERDVAAYKTEIQTEARAEAKNFENKENYLNSSQTSKEEFKSLLSRPNSAPSFDVNIVRQVQEMLSDFGYDAGVIDGKFGIKTELAIKFFQRDAELAEDGIPS